MSATNLNDAQQNQTSLMWGFDFGGEPLTDLVNLKQLGKDKSNAGAFRWFHLRYDTPDALTVMGSLGLPEEVVEALTAEETRPRSFQFHDGILLILRCVNHSPDADPEDMVSLRLWITSSLVITARKRDKTLLSIQDIKENFYNKTPPATAGEFTVLLVEKIADRVSQTLDVMDEDITQLETQSDQISNSSMRVRLTDIRRQAASIRRYLAPQREALEGLSRNTDILDRKDLFNLKQQSDRTVRYVEDLDLTRERATLLQEELRNKIAESQNVRMYLLSLATVIFLPLSFLTGVFGMNVAGLPGTESEHSFMILAVSMLVISMVTLLFMRLKHWL